MPNELTGFVWLNDATHTEGSPQVVPADTWTRFQLDGDTVFDTYLPTGVSSWWDLVNHKFIPDEEGAAYTLRVQLMARCDLNHTDLEVGFFVLSSEAQLWGTQLELGSNRELFLNFDLELFAGTPFLPQGGEVRFRCSAPISVWAKDIYIVKTSTPQALPTNTGPQGPQGDTGPAGADGAQGIQGATGAAGAQGIQGVQGDAGPAGNNGADGADGADGSTGPAGSDGADGADGATIELFQALKTGAQVTTGTHAALTGWAAPSIDTGSAFTFNATTGELTLDEAGTYSIAAWVCTVQTGNNRHELQIQLQADTGSGFADVAGALDKQYASRNTAQDEGSAQFGGFLFAASVGDKVRLTVADIGVVGTINSDRARLSVMKVS